MTPDTSLRVCPVPRMALSLEETGKAIGLCSKTVSKLIAEGRIGCVMIGTRRLIPVSELQRWLDAESQDA
jgi:excisionase family DNA binding protein